VFKAAIVIEQLSFYFRHSLTDLRVNRRLTFFALLSIAAGVAAIVSLQTLAVMIGDTLTQNLQETNRGDISAQIADSTESDDELIQQGIDDGVIEEMSFFSFGGDTGEMAISETGLAMIQQWIDDSPFAGQAEITYRVPVSDFLGVFMGTGTGTAMTTVDSDSEATNMTPLMVQTDVYPYYGSILTLDGQKLSDVIHEPTDIVISQSSAHTLGVKVGDTVRVNGASEDFTVRGIVADDAEIKGMQDVFIGLFGGYYYLDISAIDLFDGNVPLAASNLYVRLDNPEQMQAFNTAFDERFPYLPTQTTEDVRESNEQIASQIGKLVTILGMISLLVGSIGIINTMQVIVRRRTVEVAVLKTVGLQADQVTLLFLTEAFILGVLGSLAGIVLGWVTTFFIKGAAETAFGSTLPFRIAAGPAINGLVVGVSVATVFGFLPTLVAGQVRPGTVLRPQDNVVPRAGIGRLLGSLLLVMAVLVIIARGILGDLQLATMLVGGAFLIAGILYVLLLFLIWLIGRLFPSFGVIDLKIALRQMLTGRRRGAITLLALVVGVFSLSLITLFADSINNLMRALLEQQGNVMIQVQGMNRLDHTTQVLDSFEGVHSYETSLSYSVELVNWESSATGETYDRDALKALLREAQISFPPFFRGTEDERIQLQETILLESYAQIEARPAGELPDANLVEGRQMTAADAGQPVMVAIQEDIWSQLGLKAGDKFTFKITQQSLLGQGDSENVTFEVIGIVQQSMMNMSFSGASAYAPIDAFPEVIPPNTIMIFVDMDEAQVPALRRELGAGTFVLSTSVFTQLIEKLLATFIAFPTLAAALGLIVGGVVIANSVALTTMERRREIAVMKAIGLQRGRVLGMLLVENGILGLIGGLIGVGIGLVALVLMTSAAQMPGDTVPVGTGLLLMGLCILVALVATMTSAWGASGEKPLNVLRYE
jgi:putative ABC transport system permease protein